LFALQTYDKFVSGFVKTKKKSKPVLNVPAAKTAPAAVDTGSKTAEAQPSIQ
jgi:hypothetical protein